MLWTAAGGGGVGCASLSCCVYAFDRHTWETPQTPFSARVYASCRPWLMPFVFCTHAGLNLNCTQRNDAGDDGGAMGIGRDDERDKNAEDGNAHGLSDNILFVIKKLEREKEQERMQREQKRGLQPHTPAAGSLGAPRDDHANTHRGGGVVDHKKHLFPLQKLFSKAQSRCAAYRYGVHLFVEIVCIHSVEVCDVWKLFTICLCTLTGDVVLSLDTACVVCIHMCLIQCCQYCYGPDLGMCL